MRLGQSEFPLTGHDDDRRNLRAMSVAGACSLRYGGEFSIEPVYQSAHNLIKGESSAGFRQEEAVRDRTIKRGLRQPGTASYRSKRMW
jgi:hypothetical protein